MLDGRVGDASTRIHRERGDRPGGARIDAPRAGTTGVLPDVSGRGRLEPKRGDHRAEQQPAAVPGLDQQRVLADEAEPRPHRVFPLENRRRVDAGAKIRVGMRRRERLREFDESTLQHLVVVAPPGVPSDSPPRRPHGIDPVPPSVVVPVRDHDHRGRPRQIHAGIEPLFEPFLHPFHRSMSTRRDPRSNRFGVTGRRRVADAREGETQAPTGFEHRLRDVDGVVPRSVGIPRHRRPAQRARRPGGTSATRPPDPVIAAAAA